MLDLRQGSGHTSEESLLVNLGLSDSGEEDRHDGGEVNGELLAVDAREDGEEDVRALLEVGRIGDGHGLESAAHQGLVVRAELLLAD